MKNIHTNTKRSPSHVYKQSMQVFTLNLPNKRTMPIKHIDKWLSTVFDIVIEPLASTIVNKNLSLHKNALEVTWRILLLARTLMQAIRIPVFDLGEIIKIDSKDEKYVKIDISLVHIEHIPRHLYIRTLRISSNIINFLRKPLEDENIQTLYASIEKDYITPFFTTSKSGKSTLPSLRDAHAHHIPFIHLDNGIYQLGWGSKARRINRSSTEYDTIMGSMMSHNKIISASLLRKIGLPVPDHHAVRSEKEALSAAKTLGWPLVVKPSDSDRGEGVTIDIFNETMLLKALENAKKASKSKIILIERQVDGICCRVFIQNQKMLYAVMRLPKSVIGNGKETVKQLIDKANRHEKSLPPWKRSEEFPFDKDAEEAMKLSGFMPKSVPGQNVLVPLRNIESTQWGGVDEDVTDSIHPDNIELACRSARLFGLNIAGIDIITSDISIPWYQNAAIVNEVNYSPQYGGGEISRRTIPLYLSNLIKGDGRIPIIVIVGGEGAMKLALKHQIIYTDLGIHSFVTSHNKTVTWEGREDHLVFKSLYKRSRSILMDSRADVLIMVVQTDELLHLALPVDSINELIIASKELQSHSNHNNKVSKKGIDMLISRLEMLVY